MSLRAAFFMTNLLAAADPVRMQHILPAPAADGRLAMIDPFDVGGVAAAVLTSGGHQGRIYKLTGPDAVTCRDVAASGMPDWLIQHLDGAFKKIRNGEFAATTDTVALLTGRPPRSIGDFVTDHADAFAPIAQPA